MFTIVVAIRRGGELAATGAGWSGGSAVAGTGQVRDDVPESGCADSFRGNQAVHAATGSGWSAGKAVAGTGRVHADVPESGCAAAGGGVRRGSGAGGFGGA